MNEGGAAVLSEGTTQDMNLSVIYSGQYGTSTNMDVLIVYDSFQAFCKKS